MQAVDLSNRRRSDEGARFDLAFPMSPQAVEQPEPPEDVPRESEPMLSEPIRRHLGTLLAAVYAQDHVGLSTTDQFTDLLAKLDAALGDARSGDNAAFQELLVAVVPHLRRFALSLARDATAVDDLVQETLLRAWRNRARFEPGTNFEAWTFTILRNQYYTDWRKQREVKDEAGAYAARLVSPPDQTGRLDLQDVQAGLDRLPAVMREALVLVTLSDLSYVEAAAVMGCQVGTVKSRVSRARDRLARALGYTGAEIGGDAVMHSALDRSGEVGR